ncbi:MAG: outer membrane beta-barrel protein, partial [Deltaproteobacteria bacterium]|nr:outer membrane beta-barrel protein [Deltaproteobacteria bacterium]
EIYDSPQYVYFKETKKERTWNNYFNGQVHFVFTRIFISLGKGYSAARERWNTEIDIRPQRKEDSYSGSFLWQATKRTSLYLQYRKAKYQYEDLSYHKINFRNALNRREDRFSLTGYYKLSYRTNFVIDVRYGYFDFENPSNLRDAKSYSVYGGFEFSAFGTVRGKINVGYKYFNSLKPKERDYKGIVGDSSLSIRLFKPLRVRGSYRRDIEFSTWYGHPYFVENRCGGGVSVYLFKDIRLDYDYNLGRNEYPERKQPGQATVEKRRDDYGIHSVGIYFRIKRNIGFGVVASRWTRDSSVDWLDGERDFIGANLTYDF